MRDTERERSYRAQRVRVASTVETTPPSEGGDNAYEMIVLRVVLARDVNDGTRLVATVSDAVLGPADALFGGYGFDVRHRIGLAIGVQF